MGERNFNGKLYVTIDTEMDADIHWKKGYPPQFSSVLEGIPQLLRPIWDAYSVNPIYFVSPEVVENESCCEILRNEISKGAIIGAHLHPEYIEPDKKDMTQYAKAEFPCFAYDTQIEKKKLENLVSLIRNNLGVTPVWYRAARFGADTDTMKILENLGFRYDSSLTPCIDWSDRGGPNHANTPLNSYYIDTDNIYAPNSTQNDGVREYPVTITGKRLGIIGKVLPKNWLFYKWLRPSHMTYFEQKQMVVSLRKKKVQDLVMMFHSMEVMIGKTPYVRNRLMQQYFLWRLRKTLEFAEKKGYSGTI